MSLLKLLIASSTIVAMVRPARAEAPARKLRRFGSVIGLRADKLAEYKALHAAVWPDVLQMIETCNIKNYSIFLRRMPDGNDYLFSYFEYVGADFQADMARMAADETTRKWWELCKPCQKPLDDRAPDEWWAAMEEVFHHD
jgi:L-rhamnose mutarotase